MLCLSRKVGEKLLIGGNVEVTIGRITGNRVVLRVQAPADVPIRRCEVMDRSKGIQPPDSNGEEGRAA